MQSKGQLKRKVQEPEQASCITKFFKSSHASDTPEPEIETPMTIEQPNAVEPSNAVEQMTSENNETVIDN